MDRVWLRGVRWVVLALAAGGVALFLVSALMFAVRLRDHGDGVAPVLPTVLVLMLVFGAAAFALRWRPITAGLALVAMAGLVVFRLDDLRPFAAAQVPVYGAPAVVLLWAVGASAVAGAAAVVVRLVELRCWPFAGPFHPGGVVLASSAFAGFGGLLLLGDLFGTPFDSFQTFRWVFARPAMAMLLILLAWCGLAPLGVPVWSVWVRVLGAIVLLLSVFLILTAESGGRLGWAALASVGAGGVLVGFAARAGADRQSSRPRVGAWARWLGLAALAAALPVVWASLWYALWVLDTLLEGRGELDDAARLLWTTGVAVLVGAVVAATWPLVATVARAWSGAQVPVALVLAWFVAGLGGWFYAATAYSALLLGPGMAVFIVSGAGFVLTAALVAPGAAARLRARRRTAA